VTSKLFFRQVTGKYWDIRENERKLTPAIKFDSHNY